MRSQLIIVANRLPFTIQEAPEGLTYQPSPGGMAAALGPVQARHNALWVGWAGLPRPLLAAERAALPAYAHAVDITATHYNSYYYAVANGVLWPAFHGVAPRSMYEPSDWQASLAVAGQFAKSTLQAARPGDIIWIHDFHLCMVPALLRQAGSVHKLGFFLHVPVANPALLDKIPHWPDMLCSLAQVDLCGVQTARDATNLRASFAAHGIKPPQIQAFPIGIDYDLYAKAPLQPKALAHANIIAKQTAGKHVIFSLSRLDYTKGILEQLQAVQLLLQRLPPGHNVLYKLIVAPSREALSEYRDIKKRVESLVAQIQKNHPSAISYEYRNILLPEVAAWYNRADVMLITPYIDGMNLVAKEYIAARQKPGQLVLSNTAGAAEQLQRAHLVNPKNPRDIANALFSALNMQPAEQQKRHEALRQNVAREDVFGWAGDFLQELQG